MKKENLKEEKYKEIRDEDHKIWLTNGLEQVEPIKIKEKEMFGYNVYVIKVDL